MGVAIYGQQHEDVARTFRQSRHRGLQIALVRRALGGSHRLRRVIQRVLGFPTAPPREHRVHRDTVQPGAESRIAAELGELAPGLDERFLHAVLGLGRLAGHAQAQAVDLADVIPVQLLEGPAVALARPS